MWFLHVLAHVEANEADAEHSGELSGELGLAHPRRAGEQKRADRFRCRAQPGARQLHRPDDPLNGVVLPVNEALQPLFQIGQTVFVGTRHGTRRNSGHTGDHCFDVRYGNLPADPFALWQQFHCCARFVYHVDGLVRQEAVADVLGGQISRRCQGLIAVRDAVMALVITPQPLQDAFGVAHGRLVDVDLLKPPAERLVAFKGGFVFGKGGRADAPQFATGQGGFKQVRGVHHAALHRAGAHDGVDFVDEQDGARLVAQRFEDGLEALLELAAVLGAGDERAQIEGVNLNVAQRFRDLTALDLESQAFGDRRFCRRRARRRTPGCSCGGGTRPEWCV